MIKVFTEDKDAVMAAVSALENGNGLHLQHASEKLRDDIEAVIAAVKHNKSAICYASMGLRSMIGIA